jgi:hypothetical protein
MKARQKPLLVAARDRGVDVEDDVAVSPLRPDDSPPFSTT